MSEHIRPIFAPEKQLRVRRNKLERSGSSYL